MKLKAAVLSAVFFTTACGVAPTSEEALDGPNATAEQAVTSFQLDSSALSRVPVPNLPAARFTPDKLKHENVAKELLDSSELFTPAARAGGRQVLRSQSWELESDELTGRLVGVNSAPMRTGPIAPADPAALQKRALTQLERFGIPSDEVGRVLQRRVMRQDIDGQIPDAPELHRYKTFVFRGVGGIPVVGHRAVITHGPDGSLRRVLLKWPALAKSGHLLRTRLSTKDIEKRAHLALARAGERTGKAQLFWRYVPVDAGNGEVSLKLVAAARLAAAPGPGDQMEEPRIIDVEVDAQP